jgi:cation transport ATPase
VDAVLLSHAAFRKIRQNLFWAVGYNALAVPLAILGLLHPLIAEAAMALSSVNVVANSLRLESAFERQKARMKTTSAFRLHPSSFPKLLSSILFG